MALIPMGMYYQSIVETFLRSTIRNESGYIPDNWLEFTTEWLEKQSEEDRELLEYLFNKNFYSYEQAIRNLSDRKYDDFKNVKNRLFKLEKDFANQSGLFDSFKYDEQCKKDWQELYQSLPKKYKY